MAKKKGISSILIFLMLGVMSVTLHPRCALSRTVINTASLAYTSLSNQSFSSPCDTATVKIENPKATIIRPGPGDRVSGDGVVVEAVVEGANIATVLFQYKLSSDSAWVDIDDYKVSSSGHPLAGPRVLGSGSSVKSLIPQSVIRNPQSTPFQISDQTRNPKPETRNSESAFRIPHSAFRVTWDTLELTGGEYQLRAVAKDTDGDTDPAPSFVRVIVNHNENDYVEGEVNMAQTTVIDKGNGTKVTVPAGALKQGTVIRISTPAPETLPLPEENPTGVYVDVSLEDGEAQLTEPLIISLAYEDRDNNGIVDGKDILEETLVIHRWEEDGESWITLPTTVYAEDNVCTAVTDRLSIFSLFAKAASHLDKVLIYPNPFRPGRDTSVKFLGLSSEVTIRIYTIAGELVRIKGNIIAGSTEWDGRNDHGRAVVSGVYIYLITDKNGGKMTGKVAVIR